MFLRPSFMMLIVALSALGTPTKRGAAKVETDIQGLSIQTNSLDQSIKALPSSGGTLVEALAIHNGAMKLGVAIQGTTADTNASPPFSDSDGTAILKEVDNLVAVVNATLKDLITKKPALSDMNLDDMVKSDIEDILADAKGFETAIVAKLLDDQKEDAEAKAEAINNAFEETLEVYST